jgi:hypothetical protein
MENTEVQGEASVGIRQATHCPAAFLDKSKDGRLKGASGVDVVTLQSRV